MSKFIRYVIISFSVLIIAYIVLSVFARLVV